MLRSSGLSSLLAVALLTTWVRADDYKPLYLVKAGAGFDAQRFEAAANQVRKKTRKTTRLFSVASTQEAAVPGNELVVVAAESEAKAKELAAADVDNPDVVRIPDVYIPPVSNPKSDENRNEAAAASVDKGWNITAIGAPQAWKNGVAGKGVKVAVVDTGVDAQHPIFGGRVLTSIGGRFSGGRMTSSDSSDGNGHGTHVSGTIAGQKFKSGADELVLGVAPECEIIPLRVLDDNGKGSELDVLAAVQYAIDRGAKVINMSLAMTEDGVHPIPKTPLQSQWELVRENARKKGVLIVAAAGNGGTDVVGAPASMKQPVLGIGAVNQSNSRANFSSFSVFPPGTQFGAAKPDLSAPGVDILSSVPNNRTQVLQGTSMASPHVAGAAALLLSSKHPIASETGERRADDLAKWLIDNVKPTKAIGDNLGAGVVSVLSLGSDGNGSPDPQPPATSEIVKRLNKLSEAWTKRGFAPPKD